MGKKDYIKGFIKTALELGGHNIDVEYPSIFKDPRVVIRERKLRDSLAELMPEAMRARGWSELKNTPLKQHIPFRFSRFMRSPKGKIGIPLAMLAGLGVAAYKPVNNRLTSE